MKKCPKHSWVIIKARHIYEIDLKPGAVNYAFGVFYVNICVKCGKIKGVTI